MFYNDTPEKRRARAMQWKSIRNARRSAIQRRQAKQSAQRLARKITRHSS